MKKYLSIDTGETWTEKELYLEFDGNYELQERYDSFDKCLADLLELGKQKSGGLVEV